MAARTWLLSRKLMYLAERARAFDNLFANSLTFPGVTPHPFVVIGSYSSSISRSRRRTFVTGSGVEAAVAIFSDTVLVSFEGLGGTHRTFEDLRLRCAVRGREITNSLSELN
jgi:hypothetical protein